MYEAMHPSTLIIINYFLSYTKQFHRLAKTDT